MKQTGIVRRIDDIGRVVVPKEFRRTLQIRDGDPLEMFVDGDSIVMKKYQDPESCALCNSYKHQLVPLQGDIRICTSCGNKIIQALEVQHE